MMSEDTEAMSSIMQDSTGFIKNFWLAGTDSISIHVRSLACMRTDRSHTSQWLLRLLY